MTQMIRTIAEEQQKMAHEMTKVAMANHEMLQKQVNLAMDQTRTSLEMAREVGEHAQKVMVDTILPAKGEA